MSISYRVKFWFALLFRILTIIAAVSSLFAQHWDIAAISILAFFLTFLPSIYQRQLKITLPNEYEIVVLLFIFGSLYLGEVYSFYKVFWWWDVALHSLSGVILFIFALSLLLIMDRENRIVFKSPFFVVLFSFSFALALGSIWELFEYWMDCTWGLNMQKTGLDDTMDDLFNNTLGALFAALIAYFEIKYQWKVKILQFLKIETPAKKQPNFQTKK